MNKKFEQTWELPEYFDWWMNDSEGRKFRMRLGQFTSHLARKYNEDTLEELRDYIEYTSDYELGLAFANEQLSYQHSKSIDWYRDIHYIIKDQGEQQVFEDLGFAIKGRIPFAYASWQLKKKYRYEITPSTISYEETKEIWG